MTDTILGNSHGLVYLALKTSMMLLPLLSPNNNEVIISIIKYYYS